MPKQMLAATPPRRMSRSSTRKLSETLSRASAISESANRPGKVMRWSVAIEPVTQMRTWALSLVGGRTRADYPGSALVTRDGTPAPDDAARARQGPGTPRGAGSVGRGSS